MDVADANLHAGWKFAFSASDHVHSPGDCEQLDFRPASVPGTNLTDLQAAGLVKPDTSPDYEASFAPYKTMDFIYKTEFSGGGAANRRHVRLCFAGVDTVGEVWLNGERLGDVENAHLAYEFDVRGRLRPGRNALFVILRSPMIEGYKRRAAAGLDFPRPHLDLPFAFIRKPAYSFFWDWGPEIPVSGIYRPVSIMSYDTGAIDSYRIQYTIEGRDVSGIVEVAVRGEADTAMVDVAGRSHTVPVSDGVATVPFSVSNANLWWPNGEGDAFLYDMAVSLSKAGVLLDWKSQRVGFRTIKVIRDDRPDGRGKRFVFVVNGKEIFCRGYNWIPVDNSLPRGYWGLYKGNLDLAKAGGANMLRVWGGGYYEDDEFYRLCDERGLMVWQDGAFACSMYPDTDPAFMDLVKQELVYNIKRLRNFASLALWCGENEDHWGYDDWWPDHVKYPHFFGSNIYDRLFPELVRELDPDRFYWNGSPYSEEDGIKHNDELHGDTHFWDLHSRCGDISQYLATAPSFVSETGIQSLPDLRTALEIGSEADHSIQSFVFDTRNHFESPAKNDRLLKFTGALFRVSHEFGQAVYLSNLAHAEYMKYAVEYWRSQANQCGGVLIWQINDCWPAISWAVVDYNLIPKACFYYMKRAFAPVIVGYTQRHAINYGADANSWGHLFVSADRDGPLNGSLELKVMRVVWRCLAQRALPRSPCRPRRPIARDVQLADYAEPPVRLSGRD